MKQKTNIAMPVLNAANGAKPRGRWGLSHWRAVSLAIVHLLIIAHIAQWLMTGTTLNPVEPSESMETLETGRVNAGFIFFGVALLVTLVAGRFVCGWGCHFIAYQDLSAYLLKKLGIRPQPLRSRLLAIVPLGLALYMFVWPTVWRWWTVWRGSSGEGYFPEWSRHFYTEHFWETFPGWVFAILTFGIAGFAIVYFLGGKGFCTYACPYGGFFKHADRLAPLRVRVNEGCDHSGVCTTACSSNVNVAAEVARHGMVVDPNCMKCGDCIKACPNQALGWRWGAPPVLGARKASAGGPRRARRDAAPAAALPWREELLLLAAFLVFLFAWRGLYGGFPLLMTAGMSAILAYGALVAARLWRRPDVALQNLRLKTGGRLTRAGVIAGTAMLGIGAFTAHSAVVQYHRHLGGWHYNRTGVGEVVWEAGFDPARDLSLPVRRQRDAARAHLAACADWSLIDTVEVRNKLAWLALLAGDAAQAEGHARRAAALRPEWPAVHHNLARILRLRGSMAEAIAECQRAVALDPASSEAAHDLGGMLQAAGRWAEALAHYREHLTHHPQDAASWYYAGAIALQLGQVDRAAADLSRAVELDPKMHEGHYQLGLAHLTAGRAAEGARHLQRAVELNPESAAAHYNLAVAGYMQGDAASALRHARAARRLDPADAQAAAFLRMLQNTTEP